MDDRTADLEAVGLLDEPVRRRLYDWVVGEGRSVGRDEAATALDIGRALAAFHLDRLVRAGLLAVEYRRLSGRTGPGAGRPAKLYRRGPREIAITLPERRYEVPAELFATALEEMGGPEPSEALRAAARHLGEGLGTSARAAAGPRPSQRRLRRTLREALEERGYEPFETEEGEIRFRNCPFHALVTDHRDLVCGTNLALTGGLLDGLGDGRLNARLDPQPGLCCVAIAAEPGTKGAA